MTDANPGGQPGESGVEADDWSHHHRVLYRLVLGAPGSTTAELQTLYESIAPLLYRGETTVPACRRWRRSILSDLTDDGVVSSHDTPSGRIWVPESRGGRCR